MYKPKTAEEMAILKLKISRIVNIVVTLLSVLGVIICAFMFATGNMDGDLAGVLIPSFILVYLLMGVLSNIDEKRRPVMIIYIVCMALCAVVLFIDIIRYSM